MKYIFLIFLSASVMVGFSAASVMADNHGDDIAKNMAEQVGAHNVEIDEVVTYDPETKETTVVITTEETVIEEHMAALRIETPYSFATAPAQKNGAVFMIIDNTGEIEDSLISARFAEGSKMTAERIEIHSMNMDGDMMQMRKIDAVSIPAGESATLSPHGYHVMLIGLSSPIRLDEDFDMVLTFENQGDVAVSVQVMQAGHVPEAIKAHGHAAKPHSNFH